MGGKLLNYSSSEKGDRETPDDLMQVLVQEFGEFDLDPCATYITKKGHWWFGPDAVIEYDSKPDGGYPNVDTLQKATDGLAPPWWGKIYCNPPYGHGIAKWVQKCYEEVDKGNADLVVALLPVATGTKWWHKWIPTATEVRFLKSRVKFIRPGKPLEPAPFESAIVVWRRGMLNWGKHSYWDWRVQK